MKPIIIAIHTPSDKGFCVSYRAEAHTNEKGLVLNTAVSRQIFEYVKTSLVTKIGGVFF